MNYNPNQIFIDNPGLSGFLDEWTRQGCENYHRNRNNLPYTIYEFEYDCKDCKTKCPLQGKEETKGGVK
jgi:hypothetical protein